LPARGYALDLAQELEKRLVRFLRREAYRTAITAPKRGMFAEKLYLHNS